MKIIGKAFYGNRKAKDTCRYCSDGIRTRAGGAISPWITIGFTIQFHRAMIPKRTFYMLRERIERMIYSHEALR